MRIERVGETAGAEDPHMAGDDAPADEDDLSPRSHCRCRMHTAVFDRHGVGSILVEPTTADTNRLS